jgi:hypothetical protein
MACNLEGLDLLVDTRFMGAKQRQKTAINIMPLCQAVLLCHTVIRDESTHKTKVVGILVTCASAVSLAHSWRHTLSLSLASFAGQTKPIYCSCDQYYHRCRSSEPCRH